MQICAESDVQICAESEVQISESHDSLNDLAREYLRKNIDRWGDGRVRLVAQTAALATDQIPAQSCDAVVSNPPYLIRGRDRLDVETAECDPDEALFADDGGLAVVVEVVVFAAHSLRPGGVLLLEHGVTHSEPVMHLLQDHGFRHITHQPDLTGRPRFTRATLAPPSA
jgi:release factor glutamine methyltransferase